MQMSGIPKLQMSVEEAEAILKNQMRRGDNARQHPLSSQGLADAEQRLLAWEKQTDEILRGMFDTPELAEEFAGAAAMYANIGKTDREKITNIGGRVVYKNYALEDIIKRLPEYQQAAQPQPTNDLWSLIHPAITGVSKTAFDAKLYADAVETALKYVNKVVKTRVKKKANKELDGAPLMQFALSPNNPIIALDDISTETGRNIQQGYMQIFAGAMTGIRNPKAHEIVTIDEKRAIHFLFLASLLMYKLDEAV